MPTPNKNSKTIWPILRLTNIWIVLYLLPKTCPWGLLYGPPSSSTVFPLPNPLRLSNEGLKTCNSQTQPVNDPRNYMSVDKVGPPLSNPYLAPV